MTEESTKSVKAFICYCRQDTGRASELYDQLEANGVDAWLDKRRLDLGDDWEKEIKAAVAAADVFIVCLRPGFNDIGFRQKEIRWAIDAFQLRAPGRGFIIPFILEPCNLPEWCTGLHAGADLSRPTDFDDLLRAVKKHAEKTSSCSINTRDDVHQFEAVQRPVRKPRRPFATVIVASIGLIFVSLLTTSSVISLIRGTPPTLEDSNVASLRGVRIEYGYEGEFGAFGIADSASAFDGSTLVAKAKALDIIQKTPGPNHILVEEEQFGIDGGVIYKGTLEFQFGFGGGTVVAHKPVFGTKKHNIFGMWPSGT